MKPPLQGVAALDSAVDGPPYVAADLPAPPQYVSRATRLGAARAASDRMLVPLVGTALTALLASHPGAGAVLGLLAFGFAAAVSPWRQPWAAFLPLMRSPLHAAIPLVAVAVLAVIRLVSGEPVLSPLELLVLAIGATLAGMVGRIAIPHSWTPERKVRIAVIGSARTAENLAYELRCSEVSEYIVAGRVLADANVEHTPAIAKPGAVPTLGSLEKLSDVVMRHRIHLLVFGGGVPGGEVVERVSDTCLHLPVRMWELSGFYEEVFGHVAVGEIDSSWFQYLMHPNYRSLAPWSKRLLDVVGSVGLLLLFLPLLLLLALLIRRDGGPVLFRQTRIGERGRPVDLLKLRTMRVASGDRNAQWTSPDDRRVTPLGRFLRGTHLDELPQLINVIRGEMSLVGPRPEQPEFVTRLERAIPFYERRHLVKPGLTGWAQVRCGYAGSDIGSLWKLSHDLYYLKHRSLALDLAILGETIRTVVWERQHTVKPTNLSFLGKTSAGRSGRDAKPTAR